MHETINLNGEEIHLKKGFDGWRVISPIRNKDGTINKKNLIVGNSYWNIVKLLIIFLMMYFLIWSYQRDIKECSNIANACIQYPCKWCEKVNSVGFKGTFTLNELNFTVVKKDDIPI